MKLRCNNYPCEWRGEDSEALTAPHPFRPGEEVTGCPVCRSLETLVVACGKPDCWEAATGSYSGNGPNSWVCGAHRPQSST